ncbi:MAG: diadenylate cyclase CdaA [Bacteroidota bacterium]
MLLNMVSLPVRFIHLLDLLLVGLLVYQVYRLIKDTLAFRICLGGLLLYALYRIAKATQMPLLTYLLGHLMHVSTLAILILFQYEIRKFLSLLSTPFTKGSKAWPRYYPWTRKRDESTSYTITAIIEAAKALGRTNTGALIVLSKHADLKFYIESGEALSSVVSKRLLLAILHNKSPLHDGAVIIYQGKIVAARCILPVTEQQSLSARFGIRHRAAIGMSEVTDTLVLVVSEETGEISVARKGMLENNLSAQELRTAINQYFYPQ